MERIDVHLGQRSYPIHIGSGLLQNGDGLIRELLPPRVLLISNEVVAPLYLESATALLSRCGCQIDTLVLPDGERYKTFDTLNLIFTKALELGLGRDCSFVALGGGVIGDMVGYAAASYQRGVQFCQFPTTLLAQVDSSVGGKTAVNHPLGKNMIGAFHQPQLVLMDMDTLSTLPAREFAAGMAEVIKYGILWDGDFFAWLEQHQAELKALQVDALSYAIGRCCQIKAEVVAEDETERGVRALLNLGHTFGHAIEAEQGYGNWLHGEAVATGIVLAAQLAQQLGWLEQVQVDRISALISAFDLPLNPPQEMGFEQFMPHMRRDKKALQGIVRLILPTAIGTTEVVSSVTEDQLRQLFDTL
ncbi:3-dehydroquinate synthase [Ferrimonas lipolytica]|uniref:3-dehydroquinate synthase n=1 Tax=Ferrimonas lipolytica TaxID=2724191 RepID=A0A6H1UIS3_9GAMM|nr:3-dehydroquinate synthase [Ferrimonas lipolytica]QIZ78510.1 3-dehydroquinate synthase [Ferrimonas lipolytica]